VNIFCFQFPHNSFLILCLISDCGMHFKMDFFLVFHLPNKISWIHQFRLFLPSFSVSHPIYFCALLLAIFYQERMASAKLIASLMASEDVIVKSISGGLLEARSVLSRVSFSDSSPELQQICQQLLACITSP